MTLDEMIRDWELNCEGSEARELVRMEKLIHALLKERAGQRQGDAIDMMLEHIPRQTAAIEGIAISLAALAKEAK